MERGGLGHKTSLAPLLFIGVSVLSQDIEQLTICVLGVSIFFLF